MPELTEEEKELNDVCIEVSEYALLISRRGYSAVHIADAMLINGSTLYGINIKPDDNDEKMQEYIDRIDRLFNDMKNIAINRRKY